MKHHKTAWMLALSFALPVCLTACHRPNPETPTTDPVTASGQSAPQLSAPAATSPETPDPTIPTVPADFAVRREAEDITLHPFTQEEFAAALGAVQKNQEETAKEAGVLTYQVERIAYDPILTDVHIRQKMAGAPVEGWTEEDYYQRQISFAVTYSATYDHTKSPVQDTKHQVISVSLSRADSQAPWEFLSSGVPVEEYSPCALSAGELAEIPEPGGRVLAGYELRGQGYWFYLCDEGTGEIRLRSRAGSLRPEDPSLAVWDESTHQQGAPITPQPGDTQHTWDASRAEDYPADSDCSDLELLEKWMAVEGLTMADLDKRACRQLVLVVAREADGVQTDTVCYQKQADGSWTAVDGLRRMQGWTGGNGILHGRQRNSDTSPAGLWSLGLAFGNAPRPAGLKMPWRDITPHSDWVCDADSIYYNTWQERDDPNLLETWSDDVEHLEEYVNSYAYACVVRFNTPPYTVPERGCAIFLHCSKGPTAGCIGLPEADMVRTLLWMDPEQSPHILITGHQREKPGQMK